MNLEALTLRINRRLRCRGADFKALEAKLKQYDREDYGDPLAAREHWSGLEEHGCEARGSWQREVHPAPTGWYLLQRRNVMFHLQRRAPLP